MKLPLLALLVAAAALQAQPYRVGNGVKPPSILFRQEPEYSEEARRAGAIATVVVSTVIDEQGRPGSVKVVAPVGMGLDESAVHTVETWQFKPGTKNEQPVPVIANIEVNFRLLSPGSSLVPRRIVFDDPAQPGHPIVRTAQRIALSDAARQGSPVFHCVTAKGLLGNDGTLSGIRIDPALPDPAEREVLSQLGRWSFEPGFGAVRMEFCPPPPVQMRPAQ